MLNYFYARKDFTKSKIRTSNIHSSEFGSVSYDIFGSPYQKSGSFLADDSLDFGYLGKPYNADTELYDYGFRDYSPEIARFTTVDPIRDGRNWFCYVVNDPVNYVDLWGLFDNESIIDEVNKLTLTSLLNGGTYTKASDIYDTEEFAILLKDNTQYLDSGTAEFVENLSVEELVAIQNEVSVITGVSKKDVADATNNLGLNFDATSGEAFSIAGDVFVFKNNTDYTKDNNKFLIKHEVIHYIQSKALGTPNDFLTEYEKEFLENLNTMDPNSAYYNISYEKGAYSFGPTNSRAESYYKDIHGGNGFCGCD